MEQGSGGDKHMRKQYKPKPHFSQEQYEQALAVPLLPFLEQRGYQFKKCGSEYHMTNHDSFVVKNNLWKWFSQDLGGNVISFLTKVENMDLVSAVLLLCEKQNSELAQQHKLEVPQKITEPKQILLPLHNSTSRHAFAYLLKTRCIDKDIISDLMKKGKIYESIEYFVNVKLSDGTYKNAKLVTNKDFDYLEKSEMIKTVKESTGGIKAGFDYHGELKYIGLSNLSEKVRSSLLANEKVKKISPIYNCVFCGFNEQGEVKYASMRGIQTGSSFKQDIVGSDKKYCFNMEGSSDEVFVFEAPIDAISHATLFKMSGFDWQADSRVALGGVTELALDQFLKTHPYIRKINFCLDRDKTGINNVYGTVNKKTGKQEIRSLLQQYAGLGYEVSASFPATKDYNLDLVTLCTEYTENNEEDEDMEI